MCPKRVGALGALFVLVMGGLLFRLADLQLTPDPAFAQPLGNTLRETELEARRGSLVDRQGRPLAMSMEMDARICFSGILAEILSFKLSLPGKRSCSCLRPFFRSLQAPYLILLTPPMDSRVCPEVLAVRAFRRRGMWMAMAETTS